MSSDIGRYDIGLIDDDGSLKTNLDFKNTHFKLQTCC